MGLGISYRENNDFNNSWKYLQNSLKVIENSENEREIDKVYIQLVILCIEDGRNDDFNDYMQKLTILREKSTQESNFGIAELDYYYGKFYYSTKSYEESEKYLNQALKIYEESSQENDLNLSNIFYQLALVSIKTNKINEAKKYIQICLNTREEKLTISQNELLEIYTLEANFYLYLYKKENKIQNEYKENLMKFLVNLNKFIENLSALGRNRELSKVYIIIGNIYGYLDGYETEAEKFLIEGLKFLNEDTDLTLVVEAKISLGTFYQGIHFFDKNIEQFEWIKGSLIERHEDLKENLVFACKQLYEIYYSTHRNRESEEIRQILLKIDPSSV